MREGTTIEDVAAASNIVEVISGYVELVKRGKDYKGRCPFHPDRNPSFTVSPEKQLWYCFGCHEGGGVFRFLQKIEGLTFQEALQRLAERAGLPLPRPGGPAQRGRERLYELNSLAAKFYAEQLASEGGQVYRDYLRKRAISEASSKRFQLGCTPPSASGLCAHLQRQAIALREAEQAGLVARRGTEQMYRDWFTARLIFPIADAQGRVCGFGARTLGGEEPKYINSPETPVFAKRSLLYGLHLARRAVSQRGYALVVEGYTDVIACQQAGMEAAVATLGTALGVEHMRLLRRYAGSALLAFDADSAGLAAAVRSAEIFEGEQVLAKVVVLPGGADPDEFIAQRGAPALEQLLQEAVPLVEFRLRQTLQGYTDEDAAERRRAAEEARGLLAAVREPVARAEYATLAAGLMAPGDPPQQRMLQEALLRDLGPRPREGTAQVAEAGTALSGAVKAERALLAALLAQPQLLEAVRADLTPHDFSDPGLGKLAERMLALGVEGLAAGRLATEMAGEGLEGLLARLALGEEAMHLPTGEEMMRHYLGRIRERKLREHWEDIQAQVTKLIEEGRLRPEDPLLAEYESLKRRFGGSRHGVQAEGSEQV